MADLMLSLIPSTMDNTLIVDLVLDATNDIALVSGTQRLVQIILLWLLTAQGQDPLNPEYGNPYYAQLGRPGTDRTVYLNMLTACEQYFLTTQDQAAQAGQLTPDEMISYFTDEQVYFTGPGQVVVSFTIVAQSGTGQSLAIPFASALATATLG